MTTPELDRLTSGPRGSTVCRIDLGDAGQISVDVLDPDRDLDTLQEWVSRAGTEFWGLGELTRTELRDLYSYVDSLASHHAFLMRWDGQPVVLLQTYCPDRDPVGEAYPVRPGDVGLHFLLGDRGARRVPLWPVLSAVLHAFIFDNPSVERVVVEPDVRNAAALQRIQRLGFDLAEVVTVGDKTARLAFLTRTDAQMLASDARETLRGRTN